MDLGSFMSYTYHVLRPSGMGIYFILCFTEIFSKQYFSKTHRANRTVTHSNIVKGASDLPRHNHGLVNFHINDKI